MKEEKLQKRIAELEEENRKLKATVEKYRLRAYSYEHFTRIMSNFVEEMYKDAETEAWNQIYEEDKDDKISQKDEILGYGDL